jgi:hypothetical protein
VLLIIKTYLGIEDSLQDSLLTQIITDASRRVNNYIGASELPVELEWIVQELSVIRFNKIGSEGMKSESEEGKSLTFKENVFDDYIPELDKYLESQSQPASRGKARFL